MENNEIEDIFNEFPVNGTGQKVKTYNKVKKPNILLKIKKVLPSKKIMIIIGIIVGILSLCFMFYPTQDSCEVCEVCTQKISMETIKQQIISKGYAEIKDGADTLKLSPYLGG